MKFSYITGLACLITFSCACKKQDVPTVETIEVYYITEDGVSSGGNITSDGHSTIIQRGVVCSKHSNPTTDSYDGITNDTYLTGSNTGIYRSKIVDLSSNTTYYLRAYATNGIGTGYGKEFMFTTLANLSGIYFNPDLTYGSVTDQEGNAYKTIPIGSQIWMAENLRATKFSDGRGIPEISYPEEWAALTSPGYTWVNDLESLKSSYGAWYNFYAVEGGNLCPLNWHVPTYEEWNTMINYLAINTGNKLKEQGTTHWLLPNKNATNESGFSALPSGMRYAGGTFEEPGNTGYWWSSTFPYGFSVSRTGNEAGVAYFEDKKIGYTVRCIKD